jgi:hypothetical protein
MDGSINRMEVEGRNSQDRKITWIAGAMTPAEVYHQRANVFFALATKSTHPEEREALLTFAFCCLQLGRTEEYRQQKQYCMREENGHSRRA